MEGSTPRFGTVNFEKRKHPRVLVDLPLEYWCVSNVKSHPGRIGDISEGGLLFYISEEIKIGQYLRVRMFLDSSFRLAIIEAQVQVVWKDFRLEDEGYYRIGVKLVEIAPKDMDKLRNFLTSQMNSTAPSDLKLPPRLLSSLGISILADPAYVIPKSITEK